MAFISVPSRITIDIPALSDLVSFLKEVDRRDQRQTQMEIDAATATLRQANDGLDASLKNQNKEK